MLRVGVALLKARLSEHLKRVRSGETIIVMDRDTPVAQLSPYEASPTPLVIHAPKVAYRTLGDIPRPPAIEVLGDPLEVLWELRADRIDPD